MQKTSIIVIDLDFNLLDTIEDYKNPFFSSKWYECGEFQLDIGNLKHINTLQIDNIIFIKPKKPFIIESVEINVTDETMHVKGRQLKSILDRRITYPPTGQGYDSATDDVETIMKGLVDRNCITTATNRVISNLQIATNQSRGISTTFQSRYANLLNELQTLTAYSGISFDITLDLINKKFIFDVYEGVDRTDSQSTNNKALFSQALDTIIQQNYKEDNKSYKNYAVIGGQGEAENRTIVEVEVDAANTGIYRKEIFIDARDTDDDTTLEERGKTDLATFVKIISLDSQASDKLLYGFNYDLGDFATVYEPKLGAAINPRIIEITEDYTDNGLIVHPVFGTNTPTFNNIISTIAGDSQGIPIPASDIVESGSNANGEYLKFKNGTMLCTIRQTYTTQAINSAYGSSLYSGTKVWTFPCLFLVDTVPICLCTELKWGTGASWPATNVSPSNTQTTFTVLDILSRATGTSTKFAAFAIGRWK